MRKILLFNATIFLLCPLSAAFAQSAPPDTTYTLNEVTIIAGKERTAVDNLPVAATSLTAAQLERSGITSPTELSAIVPNFFMPDYGSKITSAIYIRGVGSRMNEPAVALYVDNAPYMDKSIFDFDFLDIAKVEALRGPQGTLYGRNAMGGVINIYTASPLSRQGAKMQVSYGNANTLSASLSHAYKQSEKLGLSVAGSYNQTDGFFTNTYDNKPADAQKSGAARLRLDWNASSRLRLRYVLSSEYSRQTGYAYAAVDSATNKTLDVSYNDPAGYRRLLASTGLSLQYSGVGYTASSAASYQFFNDHMQLDQDCSPENLFTLEQKQRQHALTEEIILRSTGEKNYKWLFGAFGFYKRLNTAAPVNLKSDMVGKILENIPSSSPNMPAITIVADSGSRLPAENIFIPSDFEAPAYGFAAFHQSTYDNFMLKGLSATVGLRLDYEKVALRYLSSSRVHVMVETSSPFAPPLVWGASHREPLYDGRLSNDFFELLPKFALQYESESKSHKAYATVAKGYTSGGYNTNLFADLVRDKLKPLENRTFKPPESSAAVESAIYYKPEYSWNYEVGGRATLVDGHVQVDASLFFVDTRSKQVAQFTPSGYGRMMKNAGRSASYGAELALSGRAGNCTVNLAYGYTHATFTQYTDSAKTASGAYAEVNYKRNFVPFAPQHTLSASGEYALLFNRKMLDKLTFSMLYTGAGKIYFTEANEEKASQRFYSVLNGKIAAEKGVVRFGIWAKNLLGADYKTFYYESMERSFAQKSRPIQMGVDVVVKF
ncbi:MAG: TonB-dependent receptor [Prevotellaceae bacterium]|jgi:outer membrane receptor protein involved in Fe transport|nr:TonB-dependent receptor [Prevotellaceae bacterium]